MLINFESEKPIFLQVAEGLEDAILSGIYPEGSQVPSITEFSVNYKINPATALKGINLLVDRDILYKKRGVGMFVTEGAVHKLKEERKDRFFEKYIHTLVSEARKLGLNQEDIQHMIERGYGNERD